jgi:hypothetical protein
MHAPSQLVDALFHMSARALSAVADGRLIDRLPTFGAFLLEWLVAIVASRRKSIASGFGCAN